MSYAPLSSSSRALFRLAWLGWELALAAIGYLPSVAFRAPRYRCQARALWLQATAQRLLSVFGVQLSATGALPKSGILASNHLGYLDILVLGSLMPAAFVAKSEIKAWPVFGQFARMAGTVFVPRNRRSTVGFTCDALTWLIRQHVLVIVFPEGTSSGGASVLPFHSSLLEPAVTARCPVTAACLHYHLENGNAAEEVCYWKEMTFLPHLINLLGQTQIYASASFESVTSIEDRKQLAEELHQVVCLLHASLQSSTPQVTGSASGEGPVPVTKPRR